MAPGEKGCHDQAIDDFTASIRIDPNAGDVFYDRGVSYREIGDKRKAKADFAQAKRLGYQVSDPQSWARSWRQWLRLGQRGR